MRRIGAFLVAVASLLCACSDTNAPVDTPSGERSGTFHVPSSVGAPEREFPWTATLTNDRSTWCVQRVSIGDEQLDLPQSACAALPESGRASQVLALGESVQGSVFAFYAPGFWVYEIKSGPGDVPAVDVNMSDDRGFHLVVIAIDVGMIEITLLADADNHPDTVVIPSP